MGKNIRGIYWVLNQLLVLYFIQKEYKFLQLACIKREPKVDKRDW